MPVPTTARAHSLKLLTSEESDCYFPLHSAFSLRKRYIEHLLCGGHCVRNWGFSESLYCTPGAKITPELFYYPSPSHRAAWGQGRPRPPHRVSGHRAAAGGPSRADSPGPSLVSVPPLLSPFLPVCLSCRCSVLCTTVLLCPNLAGLSLGLSSKSPQRARTSAKALPTATWMA